MHLESDLNQIHWSSQAHGHQSGQHAGHGQVQHAAGMLPVTIAIIAYESLSVTEEAKHSRVVDRDAGQGERHALKESCDLKKSREGSKKVSTTCEKKHTYARVKAGKVWREQ